METMTFSIGDAVHVKALGKGTVREVRNGGRYLVEVGGRAIVARGDELTAIEKPKKAGRPQKVVRPVYESSSAAASSIDLHGYTVDEAVEALASFLNAALLSGVAEVHIIHGRSGGKIKAAVHAQLRRIPAVRGFRIDPANAGVTIVTL
jgi:DNA mismatch repair protein MutS2